MNVLNKILLGACALLLITACSTPKKEEAEPVIIKTSSTTTLIQKNEKNYASLYHFYKNRSGSEDAKKALKAGRKVLKVFYAGRGGVVIPAFESKPKNCLQEPIEGMGDVIYGDSHLKYRKVMRRYAKQYNQTMLAYCR